MKLRAITFAELEDVYFREWVPVQLAGDAIPTLFSGMPPGLVHSVYASGTTNSPRELPPGVPLPAGELIEGLDLYRNAPDDPVDLNKDWYPIVLDHDTGNRYLITGYKHKDHEHWLDNPPERLANCEVIGLQPEYGEE